MILIFIKFYLMMIEICNISYSHKIFVSPPPAPWSKIKASLVPNPIEGLHQQALEARRPVLLVE